MSVSPAPALVSFVCKLSLGDTFIVANRRATCMGAATTTALPRSGSFPEGGGARTGGGDAPSTLHDRRCSGFKLEGMGGGALCENGVRTCKRDCDAVAEPKSRTTRRRCLGAPKAPVMVHCRLARRLVGFRMPVESRMSVERLCQPSHRSRQKLANQVQSSPTTSCRSSHVAVGNGDGGKIKMGIFGVDAGGTIID